MLTPFSILHRAPLRVRLRCLLRLRLSCEAFLSSPEEKEFTNLACSPFGHRSRVRSTRTCCFFREGGFHGCDRPTGFPRP